MKSRKKAGGVGGATDVDIPVALAPRGGQQGEAKVEDRGTPRVDTFSTFRFPPRVGGEETSADVTRRSAEGYVHSPSSDERVTFNIYCKVSEFLEPRKISEFLELLCRTDLI